MHVGCYSGCWHPSQPSVLTVTRHAPCKHSVNLFSRSCMITGCKTAGLEWVLCGRVVPDAADVAAPSDDEEQRGSRRVHHRKMSRLPHWVQSPFLSEIVFGLSQSRQLHDSFHGTPRFTLIAICPRPEHHTQPPTHAKRGVHSLDLTREWLSPLESGSKLLSTGPTWPLRFNPSGQIRSPLQSFPFWYAAHSWCLKHFVRGHGCTNVRDRHMPINVVRGLNG
jgi:hypothetical protein